MKSQIQFLMTYCVDEDANIEWVCDWRSLEYSICNLDYNSLNESAYVNHDEDFVEGVFVVAASADFIVDVLVDVIIFWRLQYKSTSIDTLPNYWIWNL